MSLQCFPHTPDGMRFFIGNTTAFMPSKGFMITEGYYYIREEHKNNPIEIFIFQGVGEKADSYLLKVNKIVKKFIDTPVEKSSYDEELGGYISFFPNYIMITYFEVMEFKSYNQTYTEYNLDKRFKTPEELLERYEKLEDYNDDFIEAISPENQEFFKEYFKFEKLGDF